MVIPARFGTCNNYSVLTPLIIPDILKTKKVVNIGDGFILRAIERYFGKFPSDQTYSPRMPLNPAQLETVSTSPVTVLAGANQLNDKYTIWPGLTGEKINSMQSRFLPVAIGLHGEAGKCEKMSEMTKEVLLAIHENINYSSWRCPHTVNYLVRELPQLKPKLLMTGCPVLYDKPLLEGESFSCGSKNIAVTVTERGQYWEREIAVIDYVAKVYPKAKRFLVIHQNYSPPERFEALTYKLLPRGNRELNEYQRLRRYAVRKGYKIYIASNVDQSIHFYRNIDIHYGSRLHAHLLCLSLAKRSWLVPVDGRSPGIAEYFDFPLLDPVELESSEGYDFERVRYKAQQGFKVFNEFLEGFI